jgi:hypothetical protein
MKAGEVQMSATELRHRVNEVVIPMTRAVEKAADRVREESDDPGVRRRALRWKIETVPTIHRAAFQPDPFAALLDLWLLTVQLQHYVEGSVEMGAQQEQLRVDVRTLREDDEEYLRLIARKPRVVEEARPKVEEVALRFPLGSDVADRVTAVSFLADAMTGETRSAFAVVGDVAETLSDFSNRLNIYTAELPRLLRWQVQLMAEEASLDPEVEKSVEELRQAARALEKVGILADPDILEGLLDRPLTALERERVAALADVDRQRAETLERLGQEREIVLAALGAERSATIADLRRERLETLDEVEALRRRLLAEGSERAERLVDRLAWRLAQVGAGGLLLGACLGLLVGRALERRRSQT